MCASYMHHAVEIQTSLHKATAHETGSTMAAIIKAE